MAVFDPKTRAFLADESGQTIVEFALLLAVSIGVILLLKNSIRDLTIKMWQGLGKRIAAPCHDTATCTPGEEFNL